MFNKGKFAEHLQGSHLHNVSGSNTNKQQTKLLALRQP